MGRRKIFCLLLAAGAAALWGCGKNAAESKTTPQAGTAAPLSVRVAQARHAAIPRKVDFVGSLAGIEQVTISSEVEGTIEKVLADLGDQVSRGQLLLLVSSETFRFQKEQAEAEAAQVAARLGISFDAETADIDGTSLVRKAAAEYENARADFDRRKALFDKNLIARKEVDDAQARFLVAEANLRAAREEANTLLATLRARRAQLALAEKKLRDAQVRSPIAGSVEARLVSAGEYLKVGTPLFRLVADQPIKMVGDVPEAYAASLRPGLPVELTVDSRPGRVFHGTLARIAPSSNVASRAIQVEALFPNKGRELKAGFFGKGAILLRVDPQAVAIPKQAVVTFAGIDKVFVVLGGVARERKVTLGADLGDLVEAAAGVAAGERVVVSNTGRLADGTAVRIEEAGAK